ncbi:Glycosyltransferase involved in cell wall bisynthesis [Kaistia soli DSM 19436]|uniref:Glycosyltransferase involved in cell wall bisynthesis n=1 Tax=Kaistia soli DSM 19436 TaxID=1122133 RepID=A0A1M4Y336_9HYPH|nr:glycosyltransferase family 4 protein [Kaistia soli]SHE99892.1 Glycosyltransferase involved in cell wall bisynthesis [Kaistia soli DSM 19436]
MRAELNSISGPETVHGTAIPAGVDDRSTRAGALSVRHYVAGGREHGGGIGRMAGYIVDSFGKDGIVHVVTDTRGPRWFPLTSLPRLAFAILLMTRDRVVSPRRVHHIHVAGRGSTVRKRILTAAARRLGCRHLVHLHDYDYAADFNARSAADQAAVLPMFKKADHVVALGRRDHQTLTTVLGVDQRRVSVLPNCVPDPGGPRLRDNDETRIVFLGRLSERKGVPELLRALSHPTMMQLRWRAVLAGDGPVDEYRRQARELGIADRVEMPGWLGPDETRALCARADILTLPSHAEGLAMAVVEGLAHGLAIVTTRVGAHEEVITDGSSGLFVPPGDVDALASALARLVSEPETRRALSMQARAAYLAQFSMASYRRSLERIYETVTNGTR